MLQIKKEYLGTTQVVQYGKGNTVRERITEKGLDHAKRVQILNAGFSHLFENPTDFIYKVERPKPQKAKLSFVKRGTAASKLRQKWIEDGVLDTPALSMPLSRLAMLSEAELAAKFEDLFELKLLAKRLTQAVKGVRISLKLSQVEMTKEVYVALQNT